MSNFENHKRFMLLAQKYSSSNLGNTFPNPSVGCLIVDYKKNKKGKIISFGKTGAGGRPHAEEIALKKAGNKAKGCTMYVTLEPCNHKSKNSSCTDQIINSKIKKIFIAKVDPDKRTNKKSIKKLINKKIKVNLGLTKDITEITNRYFFQSIKINRPYIKIKMAISKDKKIAWSDYSSKWISNSKSRKYSHKLRFLSQSILTTSKTIIKDNPRYTIRKKNRIIKYIPIIIIDKNLKIPIRSKLLNNLNKKKIIIFTNKKGRKFDKLSLMGCKMVYTNKTDYEGKLNLKEIMKKIYSFKINDILVESGGIFFGSLLKNHLVDEMHIFQAPFNIGDKGKPMIYPMSINSKINKLNFEEITKKTFGKDVYHHFLVKNN